MIRSTFLKLRHLFSSILLIAYLLFTSANSYSKNQPDNERSKHNIQVGKRLFNGLTKTSSGQAVNCASCHNIYYIDTLNWNPSAVEVALRAAILDSSQFADVLMNPMTKKLSETHSKFELSGEEMQQIKLYLGEFSGISLEKQRPNITKLLLFIFMFLIFGWAIAEIMFIKKFPKKYIPTIVLIVSTFVMIEVLVEEGIKIGRSQDYKPNQPIKFSHKVHAKNNQIDCMYCHHGAEQSKSAGIPAANLCLNCHSLVREGTYSGRFEIDKIHAAIDSMDPIEWVRIHRLPDFVYFSHAQHVGAGKLDCNSCHGAVEDMHVVKQENDLSMGWCLDCHRTQKVQFMENDYYGMTFRDYHDKIVSGKIDSVTVADIGGSDCMKCHY